ncbi:MAG: ABC transporter ATP-binding protein [Ferruginibacter sp.]|nr:ABC transporter ATP-binding protein [Ferruginibacter sp.]
MTPPVLQVENLSIGFKTEGSYSEAIRNISFQVPAGKITAIVGESGSGKSITSLSIMQLLPKQAIVRGNIFFSPAEGKSIDLLTLSEKQTNGFRGKDISMVFQEPMTSLNPVFTCGFQVMEAIQLHQQVSAQAAKEQTISLFQKVKLPNPVSIINKYPHELSGGQKQRVMIAMAISCNPSVLIADEPTTALDVRVQKTILELIRSLQTETGMSVVLISHDLGLVADIADQLLVMYKGEIVEQGPAAEVLNHPAHEYTKALMACRPAMHQRGERLPVVSDFLHTVNRGDDSRMPIGSSPESIQTLTGKNGANAGDIALRVEHLSVVYPARKKLFGKPLPDFKAVDDVSFLVNRGETVGLVGESGCGKTTLGRTILQLLKPTSGKVILDGVDLARLTQKELHPVRKELQIVFQDPYGSLNPRITIGDAIREPMNVHALLQNKSQRKEKVIDLLEKVNLKPEHFNRYPHQFSGGQRQRICIARALALNPSFLVFDESVSALDVSVQAQVLNLLNDLKKEFGFTSIFISHDLSVVRFISDRIMVMHQGKIVEEGNADDIYFNPREAYTQELIAAIPGKQMKPSWLS